MTESEGTAEAIVKISQKKTFAEDEYFTVIETGNLYIDEPISQYDSLLYFRINSWAKAESGR